MSVFVSIFCFLASISNSLSDNVFVSFASSVSFCFNSSSNFSLFWNKLAFFSCLCFSSSCNSPILVFSSCISLSNLSLLAMLFCILSLDMPISEFIFSILFVLSKPIFCICSICVVISSNSCFKESFKLCIDVNFSFSVFLCAVIISSSFIICSNFSLYVFIL